MAGFDRGAYRATLTAATNTNGGAVLSLPNPEGADIYVTRVILNVQTQSSGAASVDAGIAANGTTSADNLIDGQSVAAAGVFDNIKNGGTNGKAGQKWAAGQFLTITASATVAGLIGEAVIEYVLL
jgi:hypothetical protein